MMIQTNLMMLSATLNLTEGQLTQVTESQAQIVAAVKAETVQDTIMIL